MARGGHIVSRGPLLVFATQASELFARLRFEILQKGTGMRSMISMIAIACMAFGSVMGGCSRTPSPNTSAQQPSPSYDGHYEGTIRLLNATSGGDPRNCVTDSRLSLQVTDNTFVYVQPHPNLAGSSPGVTGEQTTPTYRATVAPDGTISGHSEFVGGTINGRIDGTHMSGQVYGLLCTYTFIADRS
jgi:hypothetical protein